MDVAGLRDWCTMGESKPNILDNKPQDTFGIVNFLTSDFSRYGVGSKKAIFNIGKHVKVETRVLGSHEVVEVELDSEKMEQNPSQWTTSLKTTVAQSCHQTSFTRFTISKMKETYIQTYDSTIVRQKLAHIYHYYIFGPWYVLQLTE